MSQHPSDMRIGMNGMCGQVRSLGLEPTNGDVYIFCHGWLRIAFYGNTHSERRLCIHAIRTFQCERRLCMHTIRTFQCKWTLCMHAIRTFQCKWTLCMHAIPFLKSDEASDCNQWLAGNVGEGSDCNQWASMFCFMRSNPTLLNTHRLFTWLGKTISLTRKNNFSDWRARFL